MSNWFEVSKKGLSDLVAGRDKVFVLHELIQNAWDQDITTVEVILESAPDLGRGLARLKVTDDDPRGFADLTHAFTLFAESRKKADPKLRGRYNLGEKLVLALCHKATIETTTGTVEFRDDGTRRATKKRREKGSCFSAVIKMTLPEVRDALTHVHRLLPPQGIRTLVNGVEIPHREPFLTFTVPLPTVVADEDGVLRPSRRNTEVKLYRPADGEPAAIYELGILVVATGDAYHVNVDQKVPLNSDRDNVPVAFLRELRTQVLNHTSQLLTPTEVTAPWVGEALEDKRVAPSAVKDVIRERFGKTVVAFDPSDREANNNATAHGYEVVGGGTFSRDAWNNIREAGALPPAGKLFPTPKPYSDDPDAPRAAEVASEDWTPSMHHMVGLAHVLARELMDVDLNVRIVLAGKTFAACYAPGRLDFNLESLGHGFFDDHERVLDLLLHEFAHQFERNHLDERYHAALSKLGARLALLALNQPELFLKP